MYLPKDTKQMYDILAELRVFAATHGLNRLAEEIDDAMVTLETEARRPEPSRAKSRSIPD